MSEDITEELTCEVPQPAWLDGLSLPGAEPIHERNWFVNAEAYFFKAISLNPKHATAHNNLGWARQMQGDTDGAIECYQKALELDSCFRIARRNLATLLVRLGRRDESFPLWYQEILDGSDWMRDLLSIAMCAQDLTLAGEFAEILAELRWGSVWYPRRQDSSGMPLPAQPPAVFLTIPKLLHDIEQFEYLQRLGVLGDEFTSIIKDYQHVIDRLTSQGVDVRVPLDFEDQRTIGHVYNRIVYVRHTPRVVRAFSDSWDPNTIETEFLSGALGLVIVDDFLSAEALECLRQFCLESTVWTGNRFALGRFGAFFQDGFNCPLLLQIAEELRQVLPRVIGNHPLREVWGFKSGASLPADSTNHADFAAVNVNFWITPDNANLDQTSGGLVVYSVDAPLSWDWDTYNGSADTIKNFLQQLQPRAINIPYRQNRAIIFNSDLFHATAAVRFRSGYENRRINITMLYGDRQDDVHHRNLVGQYTITERTVRSSAWRSAAFSSVRTSHHSS